MLLNYAIANLLNKQLSIWKAIWHIWSRKYVLSIWKAIWHIWSRKYVLIIKI